MTSESIKELIGALILLGSVAFGSFGLASILGAHRERREHRRREEWLKEELRRSRETKCL